MVTNPLDAILKHFIDVGNFNKKKTHDYKESSLNKSAQKETPTKSKIEINNSINKSISKEKNSIENSSGKKTFGSFGKLKALSNSLVLNKTNYSIPYILNLSTLNIKPETFVHALEENEVYVSTNTACSSKELSTSVMAIYNDKKRASSTLRISLSYLTTTDEINKFLNCFSVIYEK